MATIILQFPRAEYPSLQVGDIAYYAKMGTPLAGFQRNDSEESFTTIGSVKNIDDTTSLSDGTLTTSVTCNIDADTEEPDTTTFVFFSKDNTVNMSSLLGYYGSAKFKNNSTTEAELFSVGCEVSESSK